MRRGRGAVIYGGHFIILSPLLNCVKKTFDVRVKSVRFSSVGN